LQEAGFDRLWAALQDIVGPALAYRRRKSAEIVLHHAEECVLHGLEEGLAPRLASLAQALATERATLSQRQTALITRVWRAVAPALPGLLERHAEAGDVRAVCAETERLLADALACAGRQVWDGHQAACGVSVGAIALGDGIDYERLADPAIGHPPIAIDHARLHAALEQALLAALSNAAAAAVEQCQRALDGLEACLQVLQADLAHHRQTLTAIKARVRTGR
jgi:hypothetical protein